MQFVRLKFESVYIYSPLCVGGWGGGCIDVSACSSMLQDVWGGLSASDVRI